MEVLKSRDVRDVFLCFNGVFDLRLSQAYSVFQEQKKSPTKQTYESIWRIFVSFSFSTDNYWYLFLNLLKNLFNFFISQPSTCWKILPYDTQHIPRRGTKFVFHKMQSLTKSQLLSFVDFYPPYDFYGSFLALKCCYFCSQWIFVFLPVLQ